ncbi:MAG: sigma-70 family RNA polymerase sigma factor, partial [Acidimicrobiia bacterium]
MRAPGEHGGAGDEWVDLREVVVEHHREIFRYARSFTRSDADAEDLAQTAVVRALQRGTIVSDAARAKWYVMRIVRNLATDQARARARVSVEPRAEMPELGVLDPTIDEGPVDDRDADVAARAAFDELDAIDREVLQLRFLEELAYETVAERLHTTEHGARQRVYRAMQSLRAILRNDKPST